MLDSPVLHFNGKKKKILSIHDSMNRLKIEFIFLYLGTTSYDRLRSILCRFIYFQVELFWLLLFIIYQSKSNKYLELYKVLSSLL